MFKRMAAMLFLGILLTAFPAQSLVCHGDEQDSICLPIVMYHHISNNPQRLGRYTVTPDEFERDLQYLKSHGYETISSRQLDGWLAGRETLPEKPVMITFDDGHESTAVYACSLLEQYGMCGIVSVIGSVTTRYTEDPDHHLGYSHMSWEAVAALDSGSVMEVQCHTYDMHKITPRRGCDKMTGESADHYKKAFLEDIGTFQDLFAQYTGHKCTVLALPFGSYSKETLDISREMGFHMVLTCTEKVNRLFINDAGKMPVLGRFNRPHGVSSEAFFAKWNKQE